MNKDKHLIAPPQVVLFEQLRHTIGRDPNVCIPEMKCDCDIFKIFVIVKCPKKAKALASILKRFYCFGCIKVKVIVLFCGKPVEPCEFKDVCNKKEFVKRLFDCALSSNCFFCRAIVVDHCKKPEAFGDVAVFFRREVVQFFAANKCDFCGNINEVAADAFKDVLVDKFFCDVKVTFTTISKCCL